eukprot:gene1646-biopygen3496
MQSFTLAAALDSLYQAPHDACSIAAHDRAPVRPRRSCCEGRIRATQLARVRARGPVPRSRAAPLLVVHHPPRRRLPRLEPLAGGGPAEEAEHASRRAGGPLLDVIHLRQARVQ